MLGRVLRGALAGTSQSIALCEQLLPARYLSMSATGSSCVLPTGTETSGGLPLQETSCDLAAASSAEASDACRAASHGLASTSSSCLATREKHCFPDGWGTLGSQGLAASGLQLQQRRGYGYQPPKPRFPLPDSIASIVEEKTREHRRSAPAPPPAPKLEPRPMTPTSLRTGCIATKAGMTQEWDEHGVRVPLTVLWVDECQVVGLKTRPVHGYNALMLGSGYKRQKCMSPSEAGFFLKAGVPFKKLVAEWQVSEDALVPVGTAIGAAHYVAGQRVDVTGWTKWKGFQGVMRRWGFKGLPASHGVSLSHRAPGSIGNRQDPGKIWKGKKLPGCMGDERRTVHNCLVYKVDAARNLVYLRGQVPGPVGRSVFLRDSRLASPALRASWGLPFPTHVPSAEELKAAPAPGDVSVVPAPDGPGVTAWRNPTDPYLMYREETDYMPVKWKKGE